MYVKQYKPDRIYLSALIFNEKKEILSNKKGFLPSIALYGDDDESGEMFYNFTTQSEHFLWAKQTSLDWEPTVLDVSLTTNPYSFTRSSMNERIMDIEEQSPITTKFRKNYYQACSSFQESFGLTNFGVMESSPVKIESDGCVLILSVMQLKKESYNLDGIRNSGCSWGSHKKLNSTSYASERSCIHCSYDILISSSKYRYMDTFR